MTKWIFIGVLIVLIVAALFYFYGRQFKIPEGETMFFEMPSSEEVSEMGQEALPREEEESIAETTRQLLITDGVKHSIPLNEILSGGPPKDGIPSIDNPQFISPEEADKFLDDDSIGLGFVWKGEARFYPYQILVWHEIVNDVVQGDPVLVTYCPLCATAVVFDSHVDGEPVEFGVSGKLWQSNLLMYNRASDIKEESLWSQVLGEAVLGEFTGIKLTILPSDTVRYGEWKKKYKETKVLSRDTGSIRSYGLDPYGDYYTNESVSFGATFNDDRLHPKDIVLGIEIDGKYKAYKKDSLIVGEITDTFNGKTLKIEKDDIGQVRISDVKERGDVPIIIGFWFSWLAVHPSTELYK